MNRGNKTSTRSLDKEERFKELYERYQREIFVYLYRMTGETELARDLLQEVFIILIQKIDQLDTENKNFSHWLYSVARNIYLSYTKQKRKFDKLVYLSESNMEIGSRGPDIQTKLELEEKEKQFQEFLMTLTEVERSLFILHRIEKKTYAEIRKILHISERTQKRIMRKILKKIYDLKLFGEESSTKNV